ncbi:hypothetical protein [Phocaeicola dorei]|jgi:hypothetical protein|uniref:hypothetical protein n=1 Tax=Phocaeicola dorei TaxID=357276 RepID=UPI00356238B4
MRVSFLQLFSGKSIGGFVFLSGGIRNITLVKQVVHLSEMAFSLRWNNGWNGVAV